MTTSVVTPNHHGHHAGFSGLTGLLAGLSMVVGRGTDAELATRLTEVGPTDRVVDVGCGPGVAARHAASLGAHVTGIDPATVMLRLARLLNGRGVTYRTGAAESLRLPDGDATVVWSIATVHHWPDLEAGLAEVRRVLAPGGRFLAIERRTQPGATGIASHGWTDEHAELFAEQCRALGFAEVQVDRHQAGRKPVIAVLARR